MRATLQLPEDYETIGKIDLVNDRRALVWMNVLGLALFIGFGWLFVRALMFLRPREAARALWIHIDSFGEVVIWLLLLLILTVVMIVLHEAAHGLCFAAFTHSRPVFGFRGYYAFASAPGWYLRRNPYLITGLAPLVLITMVGLGLLAIVPVNWILSVLLFMTMNASGAVGDIIVSVWLLLQPANCYALDEAEAVTLFLPKSTAPKG
jgi:hypothetical protein